MPKHKNTLQHTRPNYSHNARASRNKIKPEIDLRNLKNNTVIGWVLVAVDERVRTERESAL